MYVRKNNRESSPHLHAKSPLIALSIAGFDPSSGAGITADLQTFSAHGLFGTSAITALTVQSTLGVAAVSPVEPALLAQTLSHLSADLPPLGIKIGMLATAEIVSTVAAYIRSLPTPAPIVVLDPVLISSSGKSLLTPAGVATLYTELLPLVDYITPNLSELELLNRHPSISTEIALRTLATQHPHLHIVATGGESSPTHSTDLLLTPSGTLHSFTTPRLDTASTHGTGCAFSSALLSHLLLGLSAVEAVAAAKHFTTEAIRLAPTIGHGKGPLNLLWPLSPEP